MRELAETSTFVRRLARRPLPPGTRVTSIAARGDLVVPASRTALAGATSVTVSVGGLFGDHGKLPGSPAAQREMALAINGLPPTCRSLVDSVTDAVVAHTIESGEAVVGAGVAGVASVP